MKNQHSLKTLFLCLLFVSFDSSARIVQILHTNDLHSYFEGTRFGEGGYAKLKKVIDRLKSQAKADKIETIFLDGGDFGEGSSYFFTDEGVNSLRALDLLGVDVAVLGNHDYMQGGNVLAQQIDKANLKTKIISSNLKGKNRLNLKGKILNDFTFEIDGMKIYIMGLSTAEAHFMAPITWKGFISNPIKTAKKFEKKSKKIQADFTIALTHIGLNKDREVAKKSQEIDLIIGGHSHTKLEKIDYVLNTKNIPVPIVQTGSHGMYIGKILLDLQPNKNSKIISYELIQISNEIEIDENVANFVEIARQQRETYFGRKWDEIIGFSDILLTGIGPSGKVNAEPSCWSQHIAHLTHQVGKTQLALHHSSFEGEEIQPGAIPFGDVIDNYPHIRNFGDQGWEIVTSKIPGWLLKKMIEFKLTNKELKGLTFSGLEWPHDLSPKDMNVPKKIVKNIKVEGKIIKDLRHYSISYTSELAYTLKKLLPGIYKILIPRLRYTQEYYWPWLEHYIKTNSPLSCDLGQI